jgi:hypothetical protein
MRDCKRIRRLLCLALALPLAGAGCAKGGGGAPSTSSTPPAPSSTIGDASVPEDQARPGDAAVAARTNEPPIALPRCPSGEFCTSAAEAKKLAAARDTKSERNCVVSTRGAPSPRPDDMPASGDIMGTYNDASTQKVRAAKNQADVCCYTWIQRCPG